MKKRVAEHMADLLVAAGVEQVFAVTGGGAMFLNQALGGHPRLRCTYMHHEQACAMAAEGYARIAGKPAVVMLTTGPGAINALNGVFGAFTDSIPMIVLSGQVKSSTCKDTQGLHQLRQLGDQEGPTIAMAAPVCKLAKLVDQASDAMNCLALALKTAQEGRPGPTWLDIPLDIQSTEIDWDKNNETTGKHEALRHAVRPALRAEVAIVVDRLLRSHRPLILGGTGVRLAGARDRLLRLVERMGVPMATAWTHDLIASDHPLFAGRPGTIGTRPGNFCLQTADFLLVLGSRLNIRQTSYNFDDFAPHAWVAQVDVDAQELRKPTVKPDLGIEAHLQDFLDELERQLADKTLPDITPWTSWVHGIQARFSVQHEHPERPADQINPYHAVNRVSAQLGPTDVVVCGNASACILPFQIGALQDGQRMFSNSGSASMGYDLPAAIGAAVANPGQRVVCFAGDGSLQMNIQELQTIKTYRLPITIIVLNNAGYVSIRQTHENFFGKVVGADAASGVEFPDYAKVAQAYGLQAVCLDGPDTLEDLRSWMALPGPTLIDIRVDPAQGFAPRIKSRVDEHGKFQTPALDDMHPFLPAEQIAALRAEALALRATSGQTPGHERPAVLRELAHELF
jgi:acetolactate synthase-1/2/3 large subunit